MTAQVRVDEDVGDGLRVGLAQAGGGEDGDGEGAKPRDGESAGHHASPRSRPLRRS